MHQVVVAQLAAARQGTHATKTRGQVSGGGAKPYRQKGTGRARQGSIRAPQFTGGGTVHGPQPRRYDKKTPQKMKAAALRGALSDRARGGRGHLGSRFGEGDARGTKSAVAALTAVALAGRLLGGLAPDEFLSGVSLRNLPQVHLLEAGQLNTCDVLVADEVVFAETALAEFIDGRSNGAAVEKPDLRTPDIPGAIPSVEPDHGTTDLDVADTAAAEAVPAKKTAAKKAPAEKVAADETTEDQA